MATVDAKTRTPLKFGTDGWRAVIADGFTFENVERISQAYAGVLKQNLTAGGEVAVGFDNRFMSRHFAQRAAEVLAGNALSVRLFPEAIPTPLLSFAVARNGYSGGVMITASHNPPEYNGFKIKESWGGSAFEQTTESVEALLDKNVVSRSSVEQPFSPPPAVEEAYAKHVGNLIDCDAIRAASAEVVIDSMHGTGAARIQKFIEGGAIKATTIRGRADCLFGGISPEPIDKNLGALKERMRSAGALVGVATDGDADRLGVVDELGQTMSMHAVCPILLLHLVRERKLSGAVVATVTQSVLMKRIAAAFNLPYIETPVGFKYIAKEMLAGDVVIGAEESGGISIKGHIPERDGILNALAFIEALVTSGLKPTEFIKQIHKEFGTFHYDRADLRLEIAKGRKLLSSLSNNAPESILGEAVASVNTADGVKLCLADDSWLMFRQSGTEPLLRVYCEAGTPARTAQLLARGVELAEA
jgi:phosphomannomutase